MQQNTGMADLLAKIVRAPQTSIEEVELTMMATEKIRFLFRRQHARNARSDS